MTDRSAVRATIIALLLIGHACAFAEYMARHRNVPAPDFWTGQFIALLIASACVSIALPFMEKRASKVLLISAQACAMILMGYPEGGAHVVKTILISLLAFEACFLLPIARGSIIAAAAVALTVFGIDSVMVWSGKKVSASGEGRVLMVFLPFLMGALAFWLRRLLAKAAIQEDTIGRLDHAVARLTGANVDFQEYAAAAEKESAQNERKRIARDIHDTVGYHLMNVIMMMEAGADIAPEESPKLKEIILQTRDQAKEGLQETRSALRALRSMEQGRPDGIKAIRKLIDVFERVTGVEVQLEFGNLPPRLPAEAFSIVYRMVQEGLTNAFKHGRATRIAVHFWIADDRTLRVMIRDNGQGASGDLKSGIGLSGMREWLERIQGRLSAGNVVDGFELVVEIPLAEMEAKQEL